MGNILAGNSNTRGVMSAYGSYGAQCCDAVVDPISLLTTIAAIAGLALFLRQAVIDFMVMMAGRRRRKRSGLDLDHLMKGRRLQFNSDQDQLVVCQNCFLASQLDFKCQNGRKCK